MRLHPNPFLPLRRAICAVAFSVLASAPASATLLDMGNITRDTSTGLDWLDLTLTQGQSANAVLGGFGGFVGAGWRYATGAELCGLYGAQGDTISGCPGGIHLLSATSAANLVSLLGNTALSGTGSLGFYDNFPGSVGFSCVESGVSNCLGIGDAAVTTEGAGDLDASSSDIGSFLVRSVPEPSTVLLLLLGVGGFGLRPIQNAGGTPDATGASC